MNKFLAIIKITRPANVLITFAVVIVAAIICSENILLTQHILYSAISASFIIASGNIINDIFDYNIDLINRPDRPLPSKQLSKNIALLLYGVFTAIGLILAFYVSWISVFIALGTTIILFIYSYSLKGIPLLGNIVVAVCTGLAFVYGGVAVNNWEAAIIPSVFAFLINLIREIVKDIQDVSGDSANGIMTFPNKFGLNSTRIVLITLIFILIAATFYPFLQKIYLIEYFLIVLFTVDVILVFILKQLFFGKYISKIPQISFMLKLSMIFGLLSIFIGKSS